MIEEPADLFDACRTVGIHVPHERCPGCGKSCNHAPAFPEPGGKTQAADEDIGAVFCYRVNNICRTVIPIADNDKLPVELRDGPKKVRYPLFLVVSGDNQAVFYRGGRGHGRQYIIQAFFFLPVQKSPARQRFNPVPLGGDRQ